MPAIVFPRSVQCESIELRPITPRWSQALFQLARDPRVSEFLSWPAHETEAESLEFIHAARRLRERGSAWLVGTFDRDTGALMGSTGVYGLESSSRVGIGGTWLGTPFQGQGRNRAIKAALLTAAFDRLGCESVVFDVLTVNEPSLRAMRRLPDVQEQEHLVTCQRNGSCIDEPAVRFVARRDDVVPAHWPVVTIH